MALDRVLVVKDIFTGGVRTFLDRRDAHLYRKMLYAQVGRRPQWGTGLCCTVSAVWWVMQAQAGMRGLLYVLSPAVLQSMQSGHIFDMPRMTAAECSPSHPPLPTPPLRSTACQRHASGRRCRA